MYVRTSGKPSNTTIGLCRKAAKFFAKELLGERLSSNIFVKIKFNDDILSNGYYGLCSIDCQKQFPRSFEISIDSNLSQKLTLIVLAHELVHIKQYARGELKDLSKPNKVKFLGELYDESKMSYSSYPWEKEARKSELKLYNRFKKMSNCECI
jgi:hypothetical protein